MIRVSELKTLLKTKDDKIKMLEQKLLSAQLTNERLSHAIETISECDHNGWHVKHKVDINELVVQALALIPWHNYNLN